MEIVLVTHCKIHKIYMNNYIVVFIIIEEPNPCCFQRKSSGNHIFWSYLMTKGPRPDKRWVLFPVILNSLDLSFSSWSRAYLK